MNLQQSPLKDAIINKKQTLSNYIIGN